MKVKAIIWREDRTNDVIIPKRKDIEGKTFRFDNTTYFLDADRTMITWSGWGPFRKYFATSYYIRGTSNPVPVPDFKHVDEVIKDEKGNAIFDKKTGAPLTKQIFPKIIDNGVPGEELAAI